MIDKFVPLDRKYNSYVINISVFNIIFKIVVSWYKKQPAFIRLFVV